MIRVASQASPLVAEWRAFVRACRAPRLRSLRQFAEDEIIVPSGPLADTRFRCETQPALGVWFDLIDSDQWRHYAITGPVQDGKSFGGYVIPALYYLFEIGESCVMGAPDGDMIRHKWQVDLLPVIRKSRFGKELPASGRGSRGGNASLVGFGNGAMMTFMTGGGGDEERSGVTTRVVFVTEADKLDEVGGTSREGKKIHQFLQRTESYGDRARCFYECTTSTEDGFIWQAYQQGTRTVLHVPCPHCGAWVPLEREDLHGWQEAESQMQAEDESFYACRACGEAITEDERRDMNRAAKPVHRGQSIDEAGNIIGDPPKTDTLAFRWSAGNSMFKSAAIVGGLEWKASRAADEDAAETDMRQKRWALPARPVVLDTVPLKFETIAQRTREQWWRGEILVPPDALIVTSDVGKYVCHWVAMAWWRDGSGHVVDHGRLEVPSDDMPPEQALLVSFRNFKGTVIDVGWIGPNRTKVTPNLVGFDARWQTNEKVVYAFCRESGSRRFVATMGQRDRKASYVAPQSKTGNVVAIGPEFHVTRVRSHQIFRFDVNSNFWKTYAHERLRAERRDASGLLLPLDKTPGAVTLFATRPHERDKPHMAFIRHLLAERKVEEFVRGKGLVTTWFADSRNNHWLDAFYNNCALAAYLGCSTLPAEERGANPLDERRTVPLAEVMQ